MTHVTILFSRQEVLSSETVLKRRLKDIRNLIEKSNFEHASFLLQVLIVEAEIQSINKIKCDGLGELGKVYWMQGNYQLAQEALC